MGLINIHIEQVRPRAYMAEVEAGQGANFRRRAFRARDYESLEAVVADVLAEVYVRIDAVMPGDAPAFAAMLRDALDSLLRTAARPHNADADADPRPEPAADADRHALIAEADRRGVEIDRRWGVARLTEALGASPPEPS